MNQSQLQWMATERIIDAEALLSAGRWSLAYYVAGYAVECALKSCVLARIVHTGKVFTDRKFAEKCHTHNLDLLVTLADLRTELNASQAAGPEFARFWAVVTKWSEISRYESKTEVEAKEFYEAITHDPHGVMQWLRNYW